MQSHLDLHDRAAKRVVPLDPSGSSALVMMIGGSAALIGAWLASSIFGYLFFVGIAFGLLCVGAYIIYLRTQFTTPARQAELAFQTVYGPRDTPSFATDFSGRVLHVNAALHNHSPGSSPAQIASCLRAFSPDADALAYRMLNALKDGQRACETFASPDKTTLRVSAFRAEDDLAFWTVVPVIEASETRNIEPTPQSCAIIISSPDHDVRSANTKAKAIFGTDPASSEVLRDVLIDGAKNSGNITTIGDNRFRVFSTERGDGTVETLFLPVHSEELIVADPEQFYNTLPVAIARINEDGSLIYANDAAVNLLGARARPGAQLGDLMEGLGRSMEERIRDMCQGRSHMRSEVARAKVKGQEAFLQVTLKRLLLNGDATLLAVINDATELKTLEAQFVQSQKMHAVGQLAGGVAHDFNNLLTAINGHCDLVLMRHQPMDTDYGDLIQIRHNANRAASLVGQLLAFSRKQTLVPKVVDLYDTLSDLNHLLNRLLGEKVTLRIEADHDLPNVRVDERQLEQVIMNLVVNARDAMPDGGEVEIKAQEVVFDKDVNRDNAVIPFGQYVQIDVSDTGVGIPSDQIRKIFEPFYTTKKVGEGTGLGLSTAYGIIKQTGGFIFAQSEIGMGTTFTVYLPAISEPMQQAAPARMDDIKNQDLTGSGVVLLVEDEVPVRSFAARALTIRGYTVLEAASAEEALEILEDGDLHVDIFVSDVIMPGMDGPTWVRKAQEMRPDAKVVFVSGYAEDAFEGGSINVPNATFLPKPFSLNELTLTVKEQMTAETLH